MVITGWAGDRQCLYLFFFDTRTHQNVNTHRTSKYTCFVSQQAKDVVSIDMPPNWLAQLEQLLYACSYLAPCADKRTSKRAFARAVACSFIKTFQHDRHTIRLFHKEMHPSSLVTRQNNVITLQEGGLEVICSTDTAISQTRTLFHSLLIVDGASQLVDPWVFHQCPPLAMQEPRHNQLACGA